MCLRSAACQGQGRGQGQGLAPGSKAKGQGQGQGSVPVPWAHGPWATTWGDLGWVWNAYLLYGQEGALGRLGLQWPMGPCPYLPIGDFQNGLQAMLE